MALTTTEQARLKQQTRISIHVLVRPAPSIDLLTRASIRGAKDHSTPLDKDPDQAA